MALLASLALRVPADSYRLIRRRPVLSHTPALLALRALAPDAGERRRRALTVRWLLVRRPDSPSSCRTLRTGALVWYCSALIGTSHILEPAG